MNDAVDIFLDFTNLDKDNFISKGIDLVVSPDSDKVFNDYELLIQEIKNNNKIIVRAYGRGNTNGKRDEYKRFLSFIFRVNSNSIIYDKTNNANPKKRFKKNSGITLNKYKNFRLSHVWDGTSKNPYAFCALWNICLTPYFIDPLTGHETNHELTKSFSKALCESIYKRHEKSIQLFNYEMDQLLPSIEEFMIDPNNFKGFSPKEKQLIKNNFRKIEISQLKKM